MVRSARTRSTARADPLWSLPANDFFGGTPDRLFRRQSAQTGIVHVGIQATVRCRIEAGEHHRHFVHQTHQVFERECGR